MTYSSSVPTFSRVARVTVEEDDLVYHAKKDLQSEVSMQASNYIRNSFGQLHSFHSLLLTL